MEGRRRHSATLLKSGKVLIAGGQCGSWPAGFIEAAEIYDPSTGVFTRTKGPIVRPRAFHNAILLPTGEVLFSRGQDPNGSVNLVEIFDPVAQVFREARPMLQTAGCSDESDVVAVLPNGMLLFAYGGDALELYNPDKLGTILRSP